ncbi:pyrroloquinoline quinone biosynthesis peptide chaperone PqqD [Gemmobacter denitrificans]|uniref:Pyrroloquinoline quinone biosynthesis peptide chaperone PqqD n=1 Tax=Gemmobacter denitrificans TaxID=3123040 RepID=A0ABU8BUP5_9RHOB
MTGDLRPVLPRGTRLHQDRVRGSMVLLAPERALILDEVGAAILAEVDGVAPISLIAARLAGRYQAPVDEIAADCREFLLGLASDRLVDLHAA